MGVDSLPRTVKEGRMQGTRSRGQLRLRWKEEVSLESRGDGKRKLLSVWKEEDTARNK